MGESQDGARGGFHLRVCIPVRSDGISVSQSNQGQALNLISETARSAQSAKAKRRTFANAPYGALLWK
jgi:hypothetical protein